MSPMLVVAYALTGRVDIDLINDPIDYDPNGSPVYLKDIWPTDEEIQEVKKQSLKKEDFQEVYNVIFDGDEDWKNLESSPEEKYHWDSHSTYIRQVPFFENLPDQVPPTHDIHDARVLLYLGDSVTTDHISPAGAFSSRSAAGNYLLEKGVDIANFNSYGSRRGNHEVMMREHSQTLG